MFSLNIKGNYNNLKSFLKKNETKDFTKILEKYGEIGVRELSKSTPIESGETKNSWYYKIEKNNVGYSLKFYNSNINEGVNIAIILQYGHATKNGHWVEGVDYINPALRPVFDELAEKGWREITNNV